MVVADALRARIVVKANQSSGQTPYWPLFLEADLEMENQIIRDTVGKVKSGIDKVRNWTEGDEDIVSVILEDHKPLKDLVAIMKDTECTQAEVQKAFADFAPLLLTHAKAEEKSLYDFLKELSASELNALGFEGETEHSLADQLCEEIKRLDNPPAIRAKIKVLAELVEHHLEEEESELLPEVRSVIDEQILKRLVGRYTAVQQAIIAAGQDDAPPESQTPRGDL
jgi:hemerythrin superfamily protein